MSEPDGIAAKRLLPGAVEIRPARLEDLSSIRYLHSASFRALATPILGADEAETATKFIRSSAYADKLFADKLFAAFIEQQLVATAGWATPTSGSSGARLRSLYVSPLFGGLGIGRRLVDLIEADARQAGYTSYSVRATANVVGFFERLGYRVTSQGVRNLEGNLALPVFFMRKTDGDADDAGGAHTKSKRV